MLFFDFFARLRRKTAEAILGGAADAGAVLALNDGTPPPADQDDLRKILTAALAPKALPPVPADDEDDPKKKPRR